MTGVRLISRGMACANRPCGRHTHEVCAMDVYSIYYPASAAELGHGTNQRKYVRQSGGQQGVLDFVNRSDLVLTAQAFLKVGLTYGIYDRILLQNRKPTISKRYNIGFQATEALANMRSGRNWPRLQYMKIHWAQKDHEPVGP